MWDNLPRDVHEELVNPEFQNRVHYSRATYRDGCRGPLCLKAERDRGRRRTADKAKMHGREYKPAAPSPATMRDELLDKIIEWHVRLHKQVDIPNQPHCASCACQTVSA